MTNTQRRPGYEIGMAGLGVMVVLAFIGPGPARQLGLLSGGGAFMTVEKWRCRSRASQSSLKV